MNTTLKISGCVGIFLLISSCSLEAKKRPSLLLRFDPQSEVRESLAPMKWFQSSGPRFLDVPTIDDFQCIGVNVTGPGISDSSLFNPEAAAKTDLIYQGLKNGSSCSYRGVVGGVTMKSTDRPYYSPIDINMSIPAGPDRMVQVFGVGNLATQDIDLKVAAMCGSALQDETATNGGTKIIYELARAYLPSLFSSQSITLNSNLADTTAWNTPSSKLLDCEEGRTCTDLSSYLLSDSTKPIPTAGGSDQNFAIKFTVPHEGTYSITASLRLSVKTPHDLELQILPDVLGSPGSTSVVTKVVSLRGGDVQEEYTAIFPEHAYAADTSYWLNIIGNGNGSFPVNLALNTVATTNGSNYKAFTSSNWASFTTGTPYYSVRLCSPN